MDLSVNNIFGPVSYPIQRPMSVAYKACGIRYFSLDWFRSWVEYTDSKAFTRSKEFEWIISFFEQYCIFFVYLYIKHFFYKNS